MSKYMGKLWKTEEGKYKQGVVRELMFQLDA